jgi:hypothetical protein
VKPPPDPEAALAALLAAGREKVLRADAERVARIVAAQQRKLELIAAAVAARTGAHQPGAADTGAPIAPATGSDSITESPSPAAKDGGE